MHPSCQDFDLAVAGTLGAAERSGERSLSREGSDVGRLRSSKGGAYSRRLRTKVANEFRLLRRFEPLNTLHSWDSSPECEEPKASNTGHRQQ